MTHCAIVPFLITVAHIHIKRILTFSLILQPVLESPPPLCVPSLPSAQHCLQLA